MLEGRSVKGNKEKKLRVKSSNGPVDLDSGGSVVSAVRVDPAEAYDKIPWLLQEFINHGSVSVWAEIRRRIDNIYAAVSGALEGLDASEPFSADIKKQIAGGKILFFKPNMVMLPHIDPRTHGPGMNGVNTNWEMAAAVMRWFHDIQGISYHRMALGEAGTTTTRMAIAATKASGKNITSEAIIEGKYGNDYGGWGFYLSGNILQNAMPPAAPTIL